MRYFVIFVMFFSLSTFASEDKVYGRCEVVEHSISKKDKFFISDKGQIESLIINKKTKRFYISDESGALGFEYKNYSEIDATSKSTFADEYHYYIEEVDEIDEALSIKYLINFYGVTGILNFSVFYITDDKEKNYTESKEYSCNKVDPI